MENAVVYFYSFLAEQANKYVCMYMCLNRVKQANVIEHVLNGIVFGCLIIATKECDCPCEYKELIFSSMISFYIPKNEIAPREIPLKWEK